MMSLQVSFVRKLSVAFVTSKVFHTPVDIFSVPDNVINPTKSSSTFYTFTGLIILANV